MTRVEFDKKLSEIDFLNGKNTSLENFLLACLYQLELYKHKSPSYENFLEIFMNAKDGQKADFDISWKNLTTNSKVESNSKWEVFLNGIRTLIFDLINTKKIRSEPNQSKDNIFGEWVTEGGIKFYNGVTPSSILGYAATRFEGEYPLASYKEREVTWEEFMWPIWIGISYE